MCVGLLFYGQLVVIGSSSNMELLTRNTSANLCGVDIHIRHRQYATALGNGQTAKHWPICKNSGAFYQTFLVYIVSIDHHLPQA